MLLGTGAAAQNASSLSQQINASSNADQLYRLGLSALAADQPDLARQALERVVGLEPRFAGAWLDLALATARSGDNAAAVEHLEYLRSQFTLPPALAMQVDYWLGIWQNAPSTVAAGPVSSGWQGEIFLGLGRDSNANAGPIRQQIPLSLDTGRTLFDIDNDFRPRADNFVQFGLSLGGPAFVLGGGQMSPVLLLRGKQLLNDPSFSPQDFQFGLQYQRPVGAREQDDSWQANLLVQHYRLGSQALFNGLRIGVQRNTPWKTCLAIAGTDVDARYHQRVPSLGGVLYSVNAGLTCPLPGESQAASFSAAVKAGLERARPGRAGGNNRSAELTVRYDQPLSATQSLQASWQITTNADQAGYSPLLESNAARRIQRQTLSLGFRQRFGRAWEARLTYESFKQRSNLPLFEQQGSQVMLGMAWRFN